MSIQGAKEGAMGRYKTCRICDEHIDYYGDSLCEACQAEIERADMLRFYAIQDLYREKGNTDEEKNM